MPRYNMSDPADRQAWRDWILKLNSTDRQIALMVMEGYTQEEIGAEVGLERSWVSRKIKKLGKMLKS